MANSHGGDLAVSVGGVYYYTDPSSVEDYDRKRQALEQATGSRNNKVTYYDGDAECKVNIKKALCDTDMALLTILGAGATIGLPTSTTIILADPNRTTTVTNCMCNDFTISGEKGKNFELDANFLSTAAPSNAAGYGSRPSFGSVGNYLFWRDLLTFVSAAASSTNCQKFMIKVSHSLDPFYGVRADGLALPTTLTPTEIEVSGSFTMQLLGRADYDLYLAACDTPADVGLTGKAFCGTTPPTLTLTSKLSIYSKVKPTRALKKVSMEDYDYMSDALGGVNQAVINIA